jgi:hypothetical protein
MQVLEKEGGMPELAGWIDPGKMEKVLKPKIAQWIKDNEKALNTSLSADDLIKLPNIQKGLQINNDTSIEFLPPYDLLIQKIHYGTSEIPKLLFLDMIFGAIKEDIDKQFDAINL